MTKAQDRLSLAIDTVKRVVVRLRLSLAEIPDSAAVVAAASSGDRLALQALDAFIQRYQRGIEVFTRRLYPALYRVLEKEDRAPPLITLLAYLEGLDLIEHEGIWNERIEIRNVLLHEYPLTDEARDATVVQAHAHVPGLIADFERALAHIDRLSLLESDHGQ